MLPLEKLNKRLDSSLFICVGLDSDKNKIPSFLNKEPDPVLIFNKKIIDATINHAAAYKLNFAFYESEGQKGIELLERTVTHIPDDVLVIGDAKRGDIGNTALKYAEAIFNNLKFDAVTLNPYMGYDSAEPFLNYRDKLSFFLALTSNPGNTDFEKQKLVEGDFLFQRVIKKIVEWNKFKNCGLVFGATNPKELEDNINLFGNLPILLPGIGTQGGNLADIINIFKKNSYFSFMLNISRALIYADDSTDFADLTAKKLNSLNNEIKNILSF